MHALVFIAGSLLVFFGAADGRACDRARGELLFPVDLACDVDKISQNILNGGNVVPKVLFHWGKKEHLLQNAEQGTVPQEAWETYVVGEKGAWNLPPYRRGLYGTAGLSTNGFGNPINNIKTRWLMEIQIKDECRVPERVVALARLPEDRRFVDWMSSAPGLPPEIASFEEYQKTCTDPSGTGIRKLKNVNYIGTSQSPHPCEVILKRYQDEMGFAVAQDEEFARSFVIRDRSCIENIRATPEDLIEIFSKSDLWDSAGCKEPVIFLFNDSAGQAALATHNHASTYAMLVLLPQLMVEVRNPIPEEQLTSLAKVMSESLLPQIGGSYLKFVNEVLKARLCAQKNGKLAEFLSLENKILKINDGFVSLAGHYYDGRLSIDRETQALCSTPKVVQRAK